MPPGFEWCTVDPENEEEMVNLAKFLKDNYVEDRDHLMRMEYPLEFLKWYFSGPNVNKDFIVGVKAVGK